jgi:ABC-type cobalamin transport system ATPase subunit
MIILARHLEAGEGQRVAVRIARVCQQVCPASGVSSGVLTCAEASSGAALTSVTVTVAFRQCRRW